MILMSWRDRAFIALKIRISFLYLRQISHNFPQFLPINILEWTYHRKKDEVKDKTKRIKFNRYVWNTVCAYLYNWYRAQSCKILLWHFLKSGYCPITVFGDFFLTIAVILLTILVIFDLIFLFGIMQDSEIPEWVLIPFVLGIIAAGFIIGIASYISGKLKVVEKARFILTSIHGLLESKSITKRKLENTFNKSARALINNSSVVVTNGLISALFHSLSLWDKTT